MRALGSGSTEPEVMMTIAPTRSHTRCLVLDRSSEFGCALQRAFRDDTNLSISAALNDPYAAIQFLRDKRPDVLLVDATMPNIEGALYLAEMVAPWPVSLVLSFTREEASLSKPTVADTLIRPGASIGQFVREQFDAIRRTLLNAAHRVPASNVSSNMEAIGRKLKVDAMLPPPVFANPKPQAKSDGQDLFAMGASAGGVEALNELLPRLPNGGPGTIVVQHIRDGYVKRFADRIAERCHADVAVAVDGEPLAAGLIRFAPAGKHTTVRATPDGFRIAVLDGPRISRHCPSVDVLFRSVAVAAGARASAAILTGMGDDGAQGLLEIKQSGGRTFAQDEESSLVYGMARAARAIGAVETEVPLSGLAAAMSQPANRAFDLSDHRHSH